MAQLGALPWWGIRLLAAALVLLALLGIARLAFRPPARRGLRASRALPISPATPLGRAILAQSSGHEGASGVHPLPDGMEAFVARVALIRAAQQTLDLQYYIWQRDSTGLALLHELHRAADRGVRIRLLLDDNGNAALDADLAALNAREGVEVRLFNPFVLRRPKSLGFLFDFVRLNRRMHNKSLTADGAATVLGGRNVGDIYFAFGSGPHYRDLDVLAAGPVSRDTGADFDRYWSSRSSYPAELILRPAPLAAERTRAEAEEAMAAAAAQHHLAALQAPNVVDALIAGTLPLEWVPVTLLSDDPAKGLGRVPGRQILFVQLMRFLSAPERTVDLVSAYFVPGRQFTRRLTRLAGEGVRVRVLTNSQEATDVLIVHSAYVKYRPALLKGGVELYEMRAVSMQPREPRVRGAGTRASLHSKSVAVDGKRVFIGSFNFDPRSVLLNTEMGVVIDSPRLADFMGRMLDRALPVMSYRPQRGAGGRILWHEPGVENGPVHTSEPGTNVAQRALLWLLGRLPIEWML